MPEATFIALGAAAIGLAVTFFCVLMAMKSSKRKAADKVAEQNASEA